MDEKYKVFNIKRPPQKKRFQTILNIKKTKEELEVALDSLPDIVLILDFNGKIIRGNQAAANWKLGNVKKLKGLQFHKLFHPECQNEKCHMNTHWTFARERISEHQSYEYQFDDKILGRYLLVRFMPIFKQISENSRLTHMFLVAIFSDVTSSKWTGIESDQTTAELKTILQSLPEQYIRLDRNGTILDLKTNRDYDSLIFTPDSVGKNIDMLLPPLIKEKFRKAIEEALAANCPVRLEYSLSHRNSMQFYEARLLPLAENQIIVINQDIAEKRRLDSIAESVDVMEKLNYIFSAVRHEIGNPVNAIKVTASVLKKNIGKFTDEKILEYTDRVLSEITRIEYLLQSFKSFVMFENMEMINFPVGQFLTDFVSLLNETFKEKKITIELDLNPENDIVYADPRSLHQVLLNIINNAMDALKDENDRWIKISTSKSSGKIQIMITDNGKGFTEEQAKNLFQPFFTTKTHGTGLGLVIVKKILTHMQGEIKIDSHINIGTTVTISLLEGKDENL